MSKTKKHLLWITRTALFIALLIVVQSVTASLGQIVTGSLVNMVLMSAALLGGTASGITVAAISPFFAFMLGIGPKLIQIVPFVALGNIVYVVVAALIIGKLSSVKKVPLVASNVLGVGVAAVLKFLTLYVGVVKVFIPIMGDGLKGPQIETFTAMFSVPQLITALIGGAIAIPLTLAMNRILKVRKD